MVLSHSVDQELASAVSFEMELLLCCARKELDADTVERVKYLLDREVDLTELTNLTDRHRVQPLLFHNLNKYASRAISQSYLQRIKQECRYNSWRNMNLMNQLSKILKLLEDNKIRVIAFKGPVLAARAYGNLSLRQIKDLDLLIEPGSLEKAVDLLVGLGYKLIVQVPWEFHLESSDGSYSIDLHREIIPQHLSCSKISDYAWENIESISFLGKTIPALTPEACLLILCLNGTKDYWQRLNRICDVAELIRAHPNLDWRQIIEQAEKMGFKRLTFLGLHLAQNLLNAEIPDFVTQEIQSDLKVNSLAIEVDEKLFSRTWKPLYTVETTFFHIRTRERWRDKLQSFFGLMMLSGWLDSTKRELDVIPYPILLSFLYYLIRPIRVFSRYKSIFLDK